MFVYNIKINGSKAFKIAIGIIILVVLIICGIIAYKLYGETIKVKDEFPYSDLNVLTAQNYSSVLQSVHNDIDKYVGQKIKFSGFVYRVYDLSSEQFVLGRHMLISSDFQTVIVGFLCQCKDASNYADNTWVEIEGTLIKGNYHGDMPVVEVTTIKEIEKPNDEYVYPPSKDYIPTSSIF